MSTFYTSHPPRPIHVPSPLCLLCSSSIPPTKLTTASSSSSPRPILTACCNRTICVRCQETKGRLARWDPCLACEGGWKKAEKLTGGGRGVEERASDFVLGDDDDQDEEIDDRERLEMGTREPAPDYEEVQSGEPPSTEKDVESTPPAPAALVRHIVLKGDTLIGIAFKYGLDPHHLCTLNSLPLSTIHTTPHLLHTRSYLLLLPSPPPPLPASVQTQLAHERALARFAKITKEEDPLVRKAYVELAEAGHLDDDSEQEYEKSSKEKLRTGGALERSATTEGRAVGKFFEDAEWERENGGGAGGVRGYGFPVASGSGWKAAGQQQQEISGGRREKKTLWLGWASGGRYGGKRDGGVKTG